MPHTLTMRIPDDLWLAVQREAKRSGTSAGALLREGAVLRLAVASVQGAEEDPRPTLAEILIELRRLAH